MALNFEVVEALKNKRLKISTAESVTGGKIISYLIEVPGASKITEQSYVLYSDKAKSDVLGVNSDTITKYGIVSVEVALELATNLQRISHADVVITSTGEAGPILNDENVTQGTVCFGMIYDEQEYVFKKIFKGNRLEVINKSVEFILTELLKLIK